MQIIDYFQNYLHYLIHPFKTHDAFLGKSTELDFVPKKMSLYESLGASWTFVVINGIVRIFFVNLVVFAYLKMSSEDMGLFTNFTQDEGFIGFYFLILSTILDVIFYPLFTLFLVQFWEFTIKVFARLMGHQENLDQKARDIMTVALSSHFFTIVPVFGGVAQKFVAMILMFAGLRKQLNASWALSICIMAFPIFLGLCFFSLMMLIIVMRMS